MLASTSSINRGLGARSRDPACATITASRSSASRMLYVPSTGTRCPPLHASVAWKGLPRLLPASKVCGSAVPGNSPHKISSTGR